MSASKEVDALDCVLCDHSSETPEEHEQHMQDVHDYRETYADDSGRGEHYPDDRTPLAYVYDGLELAAILHKEQVVYEFEESAVWTVVRTPAGDHRLDDTEDNA